MSRPTRAAPRAARERAQLTQQLQQQQQQPATRHRSTARRLVSIGSRRADTADSLPNDTVIKPTAVPAPTAGQRPWVRRWCGIAAVRRASKINRGRQRQHRKPSGRFGIGVHVDLHVCDRGEFGAHLVDHAAHRRARPAPVGAEMQRRSGRCATGPGRTVSTLARLVGRLEHSRAQRQQPADHIRHAQRGDQHGDHRRPSEELMTV